jgi:hypothetical protein
MARCLLLVRYAQAKRKSYARIELFRFCWGTDVRRREFITLVGGATAWPLAAYAQQPSGPIPQIVYLGASSAATVDPRQIEQFKAGLAENGLSLSPYELSFENGEPVFTLSEADRILEAAYTWRSHRAKPLAP